MIAAEGNSVNGDSDPTAHAEINAIRAAGLTGDLGPQWLRAVCQQPLLPHVLRAAHWAGIRKIYYGAGWEDYSDFYDDSEAIKEMNLPPEQQAMAPEQLLRQQAVDVWQAVRQSAAWLNRRAPELKRPSTLLCVFVTLLNDRVSESLVFPLLPFLLASFTSSGTTLGLLAGSYALAQFIATP